MADDSGPRPMAWWDDLIADMDAQADEYERDGWETVRLHPGDVTALAGRYGDRFGLSLLLPDDEFEVVEQVFDTETVESYTAYRNTVQGYVAFLLAVETEAGTAVLCPGYYALADDSVYELFDRATEAGKLTVYLRRLDETSLQVTMEQPDLLAPPDE